MLKDNIQNLGLVLLSTTMFAGLSWISSDGENSSTIYGGVVGLLIGLGFLATSRNFYAELCFLIGIAAGGAFAIYWGLGFLAFLLCCIVGGAIGFLAPKRWDVMALFALFLGH